MVSYLVFVPKGVNILHFLSGEKELSDFCTSNFQIDIEETAKQREYAQMVKTVLSARYPTDSPKAFVHTYGCQGNVADSERLKGMLKDFGYEFVDEPSKADLVL